jgi:hypothetical protein
MKMPSYHIPNTYNNQPEYLMCNGRIMFKDNYTYTRNVAGPRYCLKTSKNTKLNTELTWCEKMIGMDTSMPQHKATHKRLGILRKLIYSCNHEGRVPRWDDLLADVDRQYVMKYRIAERHGRVFKVLED